MLTKKKKKKRKEKKNRLSTLILIDIKCKWHLILSSIYQKISLKKKYSELSLAETLPEPTLKIQAVAELNESGREGNDWCYV